MASPLSILGEPLVGVDLVAAADARSTRGLAGNPQDAKVIARFTWHRSVTDARVSASVPPNGDDVTAWEPIPGATRPNYRCTVDDVGRWLRATVVPLVATAGGRSAASSAGGAPPGPRPVLRAVAGPVLQQPSMASAPAPSFTQPPAALLPTQRSQPQQPLHPPRPPLVTQSLPQPLQPPHPHSPQRLVVEGQYTAVADGASRLLVALSPTHMVAEAGERQPLQPTAAAAVPTLRAPASPERLPAAARRRSPSPVRTASRSPDVGFAGQRESRNVHFIDQQAQLLQEQPHAQQYLPVTSPLRSAQPPSQPQSVQLQPQPPPQQQQQPWEGLSSPPLPLHQQQAAYPPIPATSHAPFAVVQPAQAGGAGVGRFSSPDRLQSSAHWEDIVRPLLGSPLPGEPARHRSPPARQEAAAAAAASAQLPPRRRAAKTDPGGFPSGPQPSGGGAPTEERLEDLLRYILQAQPEAPVTAVAATGAYDGKGKGIAGGAGTIRSQQQPAGVPSLSREGAFRSSALPPQPPMLPPQPQQPWRGVAGAGEVEPAAARRYTRDPPSYPGSSSGGGGGSSSGLTSLASSGYFREGAMRTPHDPVGSMQAQQQPHPHPQQPLHPGQPVEAAAAANGGSGRAVSSPLPPQRLDHAFYALRASVDEGAARGDAGVGAEEGYEDSRMEDEGYDEDVDYGELAAGGILQPGWRPAPAMGRAVTGPAPGGAAAVLRQGQGVADRGDPLREALGQLLAQHHDAVRQVILEHAIVHDIPLPGLSDHLSHLGKPPLPPSLPLPLANTNTVEHMQPGAHPQQHPTNPHWQPPQGGSPQTWGMSPVSYGSDASSLSLSHLGRTLEGQRAGRGRGEARGSEGAERNASGSSSGSSGGTEESRAAAPAAAVPDEEGAAAPADAAGLGSESGWRGGWYYPGATEGGASGGVQAQERLAAPVPGQPAAAAAHGRWYYPGCTEGGSHEPRSQPGRPVTTSAATHFTPAAAPAADTGARGGWYYPGATEGGAAELATDQAASQRQAGRSTGGAHAMEGAAPALSGFPGFSPERRRSMATNGGDQRHGQPNGSGTNPGPSGMASAGGAGPSGVDAEYLAAQLLRHAQMEADQVAAAGAWSAPGAAPQAGVRGGAATAAAALLGLLRRVQTEGGVGGLGSQLASGVGDPQGGSTRHSAQDAELRHRHRHSGHRHRHHRHSDGEGATAAHQEASQELRRRTAPPSAPSSPPAAILTGRVAVSGAGGSAAATSGALPMSNSASSVAARLPSASSSSAPNAVRGLNDALVQQLAESTRLQVQMQRALDAALEQLSALHAREQQQQQPLSPQQLRSPSQRARESQSEELRSSPSQRKALPVLPPYQSQPGAAPTELQHDAGVAAAVKARERAVSAPPAGSFSPQRQPSPRRSSATAAAATSASGAMSLAGGAAAAPSATASPRVRDATGSSAARDAAAAAAALLATDALGSASAAGEDREARRRRSRSSSAAAVALPADAGAEGAAPAAAAAVAAGGAAQDAAAAEALRAALHVHHQRWRVKKAKLKQQVQAWQYTAWRYATAWKRARAALQALVATQDGGAVEPGPDPDDDYDSVAPPSPPPAAASPPRDFRPLAPEPSSTPVTKPGPSASPRHKGRSSAASGSAQLSSPRLRASLAAALQCRDQPLCAWAGTAHPEAAAKVLRATARACSAAASAMDPERGHHAGCRAAGGSGSVTAQQGCPRCSPQKSRSRSQHKYSDDAGRAAGAGPPEPPTTANKGTSPAKSSSTRCEVESLCRSLKSLTARDATVAALCAVGLPAAGVEQGAVTDLGRLRDQGAQGRSRSAERKGADAGGPIEVAAHWPATLRTGADGSRSRSVSPNLGNRPPWKSAGTVASTVPGGTMPRPHRHDSTSREAHNVVAWSDCPPEAQYHCEQPKPLATAPAPAPPYRDPQGWWAYPDGWLGVHPRPPHMLVQQANTQAHHHRYPDDEHKSRDRQ